MDTGKKATSDASRILSNKKTTKKEKEIAELGLANAKKNKK